MAYLFHAFTFNVVMSLYLKSFLKKVFHCISYFFILGIFVSIIFGQFTFKIIIDICLSYFFLFGCSVFCSHSLSLFIHYSGLLEHFLVFYLDLFIVCFFITSLCIIFLVVALDIDIPT